MKAIVKLAIVAAVAIAIFLVSREVYNQLYHEQDQDREKKLISHKPPTGASTSVSTATTTTSTSSSVGQKNTGSTEREVGLQQLQQLTKQFVDHVAKRPGKKLDCCDLAGYYQVVNQNRNTWKINEQDVEKCVRQSVGNWGMFEKIAAGMKVKDFVDNGYACKQGCPRSQGQTV